MHAGGVLYFCLRCACCRLLEVSLVSISLVVLAIRLAPFFIVTHAHTHTHTHTMHACVFTMELVGECLKCLFRLTRGVPALVV